LHGQYSKRKPSVAGKIGRGEHVTAHKRVASKACKRFQSVELARTTAPAPRGADEQSVSTEEAYLPAGTVGDSDSTISHERDACDAAKLVRLSGAIPSNTVYDDGGHGAETKCCGGERPGVFNYRDPRAVAANLGVQYQRRQRYKQS
jgi:hypothetical protein